MSKSKYYIRHRDYELYTANRGEGDVLLVNSKEEAASFKNPKEVNSYRRICSEQIAYCFKEAGLSNLPIVVSQRTPSAAPYPAPGQEDTRLWITKTKQLEEWQELQARKADKQAKYAVAYGAKQQTVLSTDSPPVYGSDGAQQAGNYRADLLPHLALLTISQGLKRGAERHKDSDPDDPKWSKTSVREHLNRALVHIHAHFAGDTQELHLENAAMRLLFALENHMRANIDHIGHITDRAAWDASIHTTNLKSKSSRRRQPRTRQ